MIKCYSILNSHIDKLDCEDVIRNLNFSNVIREDIINNENSRFIYFNENNFILVIKSSMESEISTTWLITSIIQDSLPEIYKAFRYENDKIVVVMKDDNILIDLFDELSRVGAFFKSKKENLEVVLKSYIKNFVKIYDK